MSQSSLPDWAFKDLSPEEIERFKTWTKENFKPNEPVDSTYHPVVRAEWERLQKEHDARWEQNDR